MPLEKGRSQAVISHNIAVERHHNKPEKQAIAIAENTARHSQDLLPVGKDYLTSPQAAESRRKELKQAIAALEHSEENAPKREKLMRELKALGGDALRPVGRDVNLSTATKCPNCNGKGIVQENGEYVDCPRCHSLGVLKSTAGRDAEDITYNGATIKEVDGAFEVERSGRYVGTYHSVDAAKRAIDEIGKGYTKDATKLIQAGTELLPIPDFKAVGDAGGKPEWQPDSPRQEILNGLHRELSQAGHKYVYSSGTGKGEITHVYKAPMGALTGAHLYERKNGNHGKGRAADELIPVGKDEHLGFAKLKGKLSHEKGVTDPAAVAAAIGRKKYGEAGMAKKSAAGRAKDILPV